MDSTSMSEGQTGAGASVEAPAPVRLRHEGGVQLHLRAVTAALRRGWDISPEEKEKAVRLAVQMLDSPSERVQATGLRCLVAMEAANIRADASTRAADSNDAQTRLAALRAALSANPAALAALLALTNAQLSQSTPVDGTPVAQACPPTEQE